LASGLDTTSIVDQLVALQRQPIDKLKKDKTAVDVKISGLSALATKLTAFQTAVKALGTNGARGMKVSAAPLVADVTTSSSSTPGTFSLEVTALAAAAKSTSAGFDPTTVFNGDLQIVADGVTTSVSVQTDSTLADLATAINQSGASVTASVLDTGTQSFLVVTRTTTGFRITNPATPATDALDFTGSLEGALTLATTTTAQNASFKVDGLTFERRSSTVTDVLPGTTLTLKATNPGAPQQIVLADDTAATKTNLQAVLTAYNTVISTIQGELDLKPDTDRSKTLAGEQSLRFAQTRMQALMTQQVGTGSVRTLADLGVKSARDGTLTIDDTVFSRAMTADAGAVDKIFDGGVVATADTMVTSFTKAIDGLFTLQTSSYQAQKKRIDEQIAKLEKRVESFKELMISKFTAMESVVSKLKNTGSFLTSQDAQKKKE
jgi:flagellar hook-associated protein 2